MNSTLNEELDTLQPSVDDLKNLFHEASLLFTDHNEATMSTNIGLMVPIIFSRNRAAAQLIDQIKSKEKISDERSAALFEKEKVLFEKETALTSSQKLNEVTAENLATEASSLENLRNTLANQERELLEMAQSLMVKESELTTKSSGSYKDDIKIGVST